RRAGSTLTRQANAFLPISGTFRLRSQAVFSVLNCVEQVSIPSDLQLRYYYAHAKSNDLQSPAYVPVDLVRGRRNSDSDAGASSGRAGRRRTRGAARANRDVHRTT